MTASEAIRLLAQTSLEAAAAPADRVHIYEALSLVMPTPEERRAALDTLHALREADRAQLKFRAVLGNRDGETR